VFATIITDKATNSGSMTIKKSTLTAHGRLLYAGLANRDTPPGLRSTVEEHPVEGNSAEWLYKTRIRTDCGTGCRTLSPTVGVLLFLLVLRFLLGLGLLLGGSCRWWRPRIGLCLP